MYENKPLAEYYTPLIDEYLSQAKSMMDIDNHITTHMDPVLDARLNKDVRFDRLFKWCIQTATKEFHDRGYDVDRFNLQPHFFISEIRQGGFFHRHAHPNAKISGVFYVDAHNETSRIIFHDPRPHKQCIALPVRQGYSDILSDEHHIEVESGKLLVWDSWIEHEVPQNKSNLPRKTIVFNL